MDHFLASELPNTAPGSARFHVIPVPMERTVSYGSGASKGPDAILAASDQLETWDGTSEPCRLGIHTTKPVDCFGLIDDVLDTVQTATATALSHGAIPVLLGGEHTLTLGSVRALQAHCPHPLGIIQLDAHADLRDTLDDTCLSHACVMRRVHELGIPLLQFGIRAESKEEVDYRAAHPNITCHHGENIAAHGLPSPLIPPHFPKHVYVTIDVDGLDPSIIPATGTPFPGGLSWTHALAILQHIATHHSILAFDTVELAPTAGLHQSDFAAALLTYKVMGLIERAQ